MLESLWNQVIEFTAQFVIPDWASLITLIPALLLIVVAGFLAWTGWRFAHAGPTRRATLRVAPVAPATVHMPGPSLAPFIAATGAFFVFLGLVAGGIALWIGVAILVLSLLYWGREAMVDFDHIVPRTTLPAIVHEGPPPGVHIPGPSFQPLLVSAGAFLLFFGLVFGGWLLAAGLLFLVAALLGWLNDARKEYWKTVEADQTGHLENIDAPNWPRRFILAFTLLVVVALAVDFGLILKNPETGATAGGGTPGASGEPGASAGAGGTPSDHLTVVAKDIKFDVSELTVPAGKQFTIDFKNEDPAGVPHDIEIRKQDGTVVQGTDTVDGGESTTYTYKPLEAGTYTFICTIHPIPPMTGTLTAK